MDSRQPVYSVLNAVYEPEDTGMMLYKSAFRAMHGLRTSASDKQSCTDRAHNTMRHRAGEHRAYACAAGGADGDGAVVAAKAEVAEAAALEAVPPAVAVVERGGCACQQARTSTHQLIRRAFFWLKNICTHPVCTYACADSDCPHTGIK